MLKTSRKQSKTSGKKPKAKAAIRLRLSKPQDKAWAEKSALELASALSGEEVTDPASESGRCTEVVALG